MKFENLTENTLTFKIGMYSYTVPPLEDCEIPNEIAYVVQSRGLPLTPVGKMPVDKGKVKPIEHTRKTTAVFSEDLSDIPLPSEE